MPFQAFWLKLLSSMPPVSLTWQALKAVADGDGEALADGEADGDGEVAADGAGEAPPPHAAAMPRLPGRPARSQPMSADARPSSVCAPRHGHSSPAGPAGG